MRRFGAQFAAADIGDVGEVALQEGSHTLRPSGDAPGARQRGSQPIRDSWARAALLLIGPADLVAQRDDTGAGQRGDIDDGGFGPGCR